MSARSEVFDKIAAERAASPWDDAQKTRETRARLEKLAEHHESRARYPVNVAGSDRCIYQTQKFHADAALDIRAALNVKGVA